MAPYGCAVRLMCGVGDTKAGTLIAKDRYGNKYFENLEDELPCELASDMRRTLRF